MKSTSRNINPIFTQTTRSINTTPYYRLVQMYHRVAASMLAMACLGTALLTSTSHATNHRPPVINVGDFGGTLIGSDFGTSFSQVRMPTGMTRRCDNPSVFGDDLFQYNYGTARIGSPFQASTAPVFGALGKPDVLTNPGTHYNSMVSPNTIGSGGLDNNPNVNPTITQSFMGPNSSRFGGGNVAVSQGKITGSVTDRKQVPGDTGASYVVAVFEETYEITGTGSLGGALAFNAILPKSVPLLNQIPGAAAVALTTTMVSPGTVIQLPGGDVVDADCFRLGSIVSSVSEGVDDGIDNLNTGPQENLFGNSDVGKIVDGDFGTLLGLTGGVTISSKSINTLAGITPVDEVYQVAGVWNTGTIKFVSGPSIVTLRSTLTIIADPGAKIQLRAFSQSEYDILPHNADAFVFASGTIVPEPSSFVLLSTLLLGLGSVRRCRRQR